MTNQEAYLDDLESLRKETDTEITAMPKEIAALALELQERQDMKDVGEK